MRTTANAKKACSKCDKSAGAFSCDGCQQSFCLKHVTEHRQELISQIDTIEQEHDIFHEDLINQMEKQNEHFLFDRINQWEQESMTKIQQVAEQSRIELKQMLHSNTDYGKKSLNEILLKLRRSRELDDFFENDLTQWKQQITQLREQIKSLSNSIDIISDNSASVIRFIKIVQNQTLVNPETNWTRRFSWLSDVKTFSQKFLSTEDKETKQCSTQSYTKGPINFIKVNNIDHYIDMENEGSIERDQNMTGWILRREVDKKSKIIYKFPENFILKSRSIVRILYDQKNGIEKKQKEILVDENKESWDIGANIITRLIDANGEEKASIVQTFVPL